MKLKQVTNWIVINHSRCCESKSNLFIDTILVLKSAKEINLQNGNLFSIKVCMLMKPKGSNEEANFEFNWTKSEISYENRFDFNASFCYKNRKKSILITDIEIKSSSRNEFRCWHLYF